jgi:hypothetical protein
MPEIMEPTSTEFFDMGLIEPRAAARVDPTSGAERCRERMDAPLWHPRDSVTASL